MIWWRCRYASKTLLDIDMGLLNEQVDEKSISSLNLNFISNLA